MDDTRRNPEINSASSDSATVDGFKNNSPRLAGQRPRQFFGKTV
jgi:hypothetical protein